MYCFKVIKKLVAVFCKVIAAVFAYHNASVIKYQRVFVSAAVNNREQI